MKRLVIISVILPVMLGCVSAVRSQGETANTDGRRTAPEESRPRSAPAELTFLDTVNQGKEVALSENDISSLDVSDKSAQVTKTANSSATRYRIQILASSQIDLVRQEKKTVESKTSLPAFMSMEQPFYKLYVGDFSTRKEAEAQLKKVRKKGYTDAWIVRTRAFSE
ncbi:MAG: SPOR domain-containing protein [Fibrobacterota bacterium]